MRKLAEELEQFFESVEFSGTLGFVHSYIRVVLKHHGFNVVTDKDFFDELAIVEQYLPKAETIINKLRAEWVDHAQSVVGILPFNYCRSLESFPRFCSSARGRFRG